MKNVDFSAKHDIWIRHKDGKLTPMDEPYYESKKINDETWQIMSSGDYHYLLIGEGEGISIDTGYGAGNLREYLESIGKVPVPCVINTHSHFDHTANNCYFEKAYMAEEGVKLASIPYESFRGVLFPKNYEIEIVKDHDIISLPGRSLEIFRCGDHTRDGIMILDRKYRILFTGDEIMMGRKTLNGTVKQWKMNLEKIAIHRSEFDIICGGFGISDASEFDRFYDTVQCLWRGVPSDAAPERKSMPRMEPMMEDGHKVYDCQIPHIEDIPKDGFFKENNSMVSYYHGGCELTYDKTQIN